MTEIRMRACLAMVANALFLSSAMSQQPPLVSGEQRAALNVLHVGPGRDVRTLRRAAEVARDGDVVEIDAGEYKADPAVWTQKDLTIRGVGARPKLAADGTVAEGKAIFVVRGDNVTLENLAFSGARVADRNGAGVRLERGRMKVIGCTFEDNENGILTSNDAGIELRVVNSTFLNNGAGDGMSHHLYAGTIEIVEVTGSYFGPARKGHLLKSRAKVTNVYYNRLTGEGGTSSYEMDLPNGGNLRAIGNLVQQGNQTDNRALISFGAEGYRWPVNRAYIAFNTLVNDLQEGGVFIVVRPGPAEAIILNNLLVGRGDFDAKAKAIIKGNMPARLSDFADASKFDYRLRIGSSLAGSAGPAGAFPKQDRPAAEYRHSAGVVNLGELSDLTPLSPGAFQRLTR